MTMQEQPDDRQFDEIVTTDDLLHRRGARPVATLDELAATEDPFESDAEHEAFLADLYASRGVDDG